MCYAAFLLLHSHQSLLHMQRLFTHSTRFKLQADLRLRAWSRVRSTTSRRRQAAQSCMPPATGSRRVVTVATIAARYASLHTGSSVVTCMMCADAAMADGAAQWSWRHCDVSHATQPVLVRVRDAYMWLI